MNRFFLERINSLMSLKRRSIVNRGFKNILVVSSTALGDTILSTPAIKTLRKNYPDLFINFLISKNIYSLFEGYEMIDNIVTYERSFLGLLKTIFFLRKAKVDTIFFLHSNGPQDLFLAYFSGAEKILKACNFPSPISLGFKRIMSNLDTYHVDQHIIEHRLGLIKYFKPKRIFKELNLPEKFKISKSKKDYICIQLSAADEYKIWPLRNFSDLMEKVSRKYQNYDVFVLGLESENFLAEEFIRKSSYPNKIKNFCGKTSLEQLSNILSKSKLLITNDTGTLHLAIALKVPTVSLFSPTNPNHFGPYQDNEIHKVVFSEVEIDNYLPKKRRSNRAMSSIAVNDVLEKVVETLSGK